MFQYLWFFHKMFTVGLICLNHYPNKDHLLHLTVFKVVLNPPLITWFEICLQPGKSIRWRSLLEVFWMIGIYCFVSALLIVFFFFTRNSQEARKQIFLGYLWTWNLCYCFGYIPNKPQVYTTGASGNEDKGMMTVNCP